MAQLQRRIARHKGHVAGRALWTKAEESLLTSMYPGYGRILPKLPGRTYYAVRGKAQGLKIQAKRHIWTGAELSTLRKLIYRGATGAQLQEAFPECGKDQLWHVAAYHGIRRPRARLKPSGIRIVDDIRERAHQLGYTMVDLDKEARTGKYFQKANWHSAGGVDGRYIGKAVKVLGGVLTVEWSE